MCAVNPIVRSKRPVEPRARCAKELRVSGDSRAQCCVNFRMTLTKHWFAIQIAHVPSIQRKLGRIRFPVGEAYYTLPWQRD